MVRILFVCLGNICRSPMAEAVFNDIVKKEKLEYKYIVDSAAIGPWHVGNRPHHMTLAKLRENNIDCDYLYARRLSKDDGTKFDYIIGMDDENIDDIINRIGNQHKEKVRKLLSFAGMKRDIDDPYYTQNFDKCFEDISMGCRALFNVLENKVK